MIGSWTKSEWFAAACGTDGDCEWGVDTRDGWHIAVACGGMDGATESNAALIAEAGTVANETGLSPRQLADQRAELLDGLTLAANRLHALKVELMTDNNPAHFEVGEWVDHARAVIAKCTGAA